MRNIGVIIAFSVACSATPALADEYFAVTPSGQTEAIFDKSVSETTDALAGKCIDVGWTVVESTNTVVVCEAPMNFGQSLVGTLLMGNSYSTPPRTYYRFNVAGVRGASRVQASGWMELQMAFGQTRRNDFVGPEFHNGATNFLVAAGGRLPPGTTFPNHVVLGVELDDSYSKSGVRVRSVETGSVAEDAGIRAGDMITRLARKRIDSPDDWMDGAAKAAEKESYEVEFTRDGNKKKAILARTFRPAVIAPIGGNDTSRELVEVAGKNEPGPTVNSGTSIADELAKFAKLRADGVISEEEFETQKAKLLNNPQP